MFAGKNIQDNNFQHICKSYYLYKEGLKPIEMLWRSEAQYEDKILKNTQVENFLVGQETIENPSTADHHITVSEIAYGIEISYGGVQAIVTNDLGYHR